MKVVWSPLAELRTAEAFVYITNDRPSAAVPSLDRLLDAVATLAAFPDRGRAVPELQRPEIRELIIAPYRVIYLRDVKRVVVLTVRHGRRKLDEREVAR